VSLTSASTEARRWIAWFFCSAVFSGSRWEGQEEEGLPTHLGRAWRSGFEGSGSHHKGAKSLSSMQPDLKHLQYIWAVHIWREIEVEMGNVGWRSDKVCSVPRHFLKSVSLHPCSSLITCPKILLEFRLSVYNIPLNRSVG
jgi:hypothetical protein